MAEAVTSQVFCPMARAKRRETALPRAEVRRAVTRTALALERADPVRTVKVLVEESQVPNSMSLVVSRTTEEPSAVLLAAMAAASVWAWETLVFRELAPA